MKVRDVIRRIENDGWEFERQRGSHRVYRHPNKTGTVTIAGTPGKDVPVRYPGQHPAASRTERTEAMNEYAVVYEHGPTGWAAYCPDLPGLGVVGDTREEAEQLIRRASYCTSRACANTTSPCRSPHPLSARSRSPPRSQPRRSDSLARGRG